MADLYSIDLEQFSLERFRHNLEAGDVLPGRVILKEDIPGRFAILESMGIRNLKDLNTALKTQKHVVKFAQESGLPEDYLVILRREVGSYLAKPLPLAKIPGVNADYVAALAAVGIKHTKHMFERARTKSSRAELLELVAVPEAALLEFIQMSDLARINGVGPVFIRIFFEAGVHNLVELLEWAESPEALFDRLIAVNQEQKLTKALFTLKDVEYCIAIAKELPKVIEY